MNIIRLSDCSKRQLAFNRNETQQPFKKPFYETVPCSIYLAPSIGSFIAIFITISLAASAFRKINFYKIPRYIWDHYWIRPSNIDYVQSYRLLNNDISANKQFYPLPNVKTIDQQQLTEG